MKNLMHCYKNKNVLKICNTYFNFLECTYFFMYKFLHTFLHKTHADVYIAYVYINYNFHLEININFYIIISISIF